MVKKKAWNCHETTFRGPFSVNLNDCLDEMFCLAVIVWNDPVVTFLFSWMHWKLCDTVDQETTSKEPEKEALEHLYSPGETNIIEMGKVGLGASTWEEYLYSQGKKNRTNAPSQMFMIKPWRSPGLETAVPIFLRRSEALRFIKSCSQVPFYQMGNLFLNKLFDGYGWGRC